MLEGNVTGRNDIPLMFKLQFPHSWQDSSFERGNLLLAQNCGSVQSHTSQLYWSIEPLLGHHGAKGPPGLNYVACCGEYDTVLQFMTNEVAVNWVLQIYIGLA